MVSAQNNSEAQHALHGKIVRIGLATRVLKVLGALGALATVSACASSGVNVSANGSRWGVPVSANTHLGRSQKYSRNGKSSPSIAGSSGHQKIGRPYQIAGRTYIPARQDDYNRTGVASWYGQKFHGRKTANGEIFDMNAMSAAHTTLPLPSLVRVTNLENGRSIIVRVNDRGPFVDNRLIDLSKKAAGELGYVKQGIAKVRVQYVGPAIGGSGVNGSRASVRTASSSNRAPAAKVWPQPASARPATNGGWPEASEDKYPIALSKPRVAPSGWFVQLGAFGDRGRAERIAANLDTSGQAKVQTAWINNHYIHRVLVGPYRDQNSAYRQQQEVANAGYPEARVTEQR